MMTTLTKPITLCRTGYLLQRFLRRSSRHCIDARRVNACINPRARWIATCNTIAMPKSRRWAARTVTTIRDESINWNAICGRHTIRHHEMISVKKLSSVRCTLISFIVVDLHLNIMLLLRSLACSSFIFSKQMFLNCVRVHLIAISSDSQMIRCWVCFSVAMAVARHIKTNDCLKFTDRSCAARFRKYSPAFTANTCRCARPIWNGTHFQGIPNSSSRRNATTREYECSKQSPNKYRDRLKSSL